MFFSTLLVGASMLSIALTDNVRTEEPLTDTLRTAVVVADKGLAISKTDSLTVKSFSTITDVLHQSSSLLVNDNGGASGLKTVSIRGMGSAHTVIYIDGVKVGNVQSGQGDLSNLGLNQFNSAVVDYAQSSISFTTARPVFQEDRKVAGQASLSAGSFNTWTPYGRLDFKLSPKVSLSANVGGLFSKGNFKYGDGLVRENNDISQIRGGLDVFGLTRGGKWHAKAHFGSTDRGTPGSLSWPSTDRQADRNAYAQGHLEERFSSIYSLTASAKYAFDRLDYNSSYGDSRYDQQEIQLNTSHKFTLARWVDLIFAADLVWDGLKSTAYNAERFSPTSSLGAAFRTERFNADLAVEYNGAIDKDGLSRHNVSPSADLRFSILDGLDLTAYGRRAYRVPVFNELYYEGYGNPELLPEDAWLSGLGLGFNKKFGSWTLKASADGFFNSLSNKIISAPSQADPYLWLPYNIGKVRSTGVDLAAGFIFVNNGWTASFDAKYGYQSAIDKTESSTSFGEQIPYVAKHSLNLNGSVSFKGWKLDAVWNLRADRKDSYGELPDWNTLDATLSKEIALRKCGPLTLFITGRNLSDQRYESVSGYPMPGISVTGGFNFKF